MANLAVQRAKRAGAAFAQAKDVMMHFAPFEMPFLGGSEMNLNIKAYSFVRLPLRLARGLAVPAND